jgi:hypothetical protein
MLKSFKACSSQNQHNQTHCDISTNTVFAKFKPIPEDKL